MTKDTLTPEKVEEAKALLLEENKKKQEACAKEIGEVLEKHGFNLQPVANIQLIPSN